MRKGFFLILQAGHSAKWKAWLTAVLHVFISTGWIPKVGGIRQKGENVVTPSVFREFYDSKTQRKRVSTSSGSKQAGL